jgi:hypothetical protein
MFALKTISIIPDGCFGVLLDNEVPFAVTLERTYDNGHTKIPAGIHRCQRSRYNKGGYDTFEIEIEGHSRILFHKGNTELHSEGCILVAESFAMFGDKPGIAMSGEGFGEFMKRAGSIDNFMLTVFR